MSKNPDKPLSKRLASILAGLAIITVVTVPVFHPVAARELQGASDEATAKRIAPVGQVNVGKRREPPPSEAAPPIETVAEASPESASASGDKGKEVYDSACFMCHTPGVAGAPKLGDKAAWTPRIAQGMDTLSDHAIDGFQGSAGLMPPRGGRTDLTDEDIKAAVTYMVGASQ